MKHTRQAVQARVASTKGLDWTSSRVAPARHTTTGRAKGGKPDERGRRMTGRVARVFYGQGHGFIRAEDTRDLFFHHRDVVAGGFHALAVHDRVMFEVVEDAIAGPRAVKVRRATRIRGGRR